MLRQEVLKLYREVLRTARKVDKDQRTEIIQWARSDFEVHRSQTNEVLPSFPHFFHVVFTNSLYRKPSEAFFLMGNKW